MQQLYFKNKTKKDRMELISCLYWLMDNPIHQ